MRELVVEVLQVLHMRDELLDVLIGSLKFLLEPDQPLE